MYNLKRILTLLNTYDNGPTVNGLIQEAITEACHLEKQESESPQEMRDLFAAVGLIALANEETGTPPVFHADMAKEAWNLSDHMMDERARRIASRACRVQPTEPKDSIGE